MWITLTIDDLANSLIAGEVAKVVQISGNGDNRAALIDQVTAEVRGYVATKNPLGLAGTIPEELRDAAVNLVVWRFVGGIPSDKLATTTRKAAADNARTLLRDVASGSYRIVAPETPAPTAEQTQRPGVLTIQPGNRGNGREELRRL